MSGFAMTKNGSMQQGFSLPEALIAMLLLSVSLLGLLNYYQSLTNGFMRQWQTQEAWAEAHSQLEAHAATGKGTEPLAENWSYQLSGIPAGEFCQRVQVTVQTPAKYQAVLHRLECKFEP
jgi:prepilin peptidase dependent protein C